MIIVTVITIFKAEFDRKQRKNKEIIRLNWSLINLTYAFIWTALFITWLIIFINSVQKVYRLLNKEYIDSVFQLVNIKYLRSLRGYFFENYMLIHLNAIAHYESNFLLMLGWTIGSFCLSISHLHRGWQKNAIYENGILVNDKIINWHDIVSYGWSRSYKEGLFKNEKYYELVITLHKSKLCNLDNKVELQVNYHDKELVDHILKNFEISKGI